MSDENNDKRQQEDKGFRVVDSRRFDHSGAERADNRGESEANPQPNSDGAGSQIQPEASDIKGFTITEGDQPSESEPVAFTSFIMSLATQVLVQLGEMPAPQGMEIPRDVEAARQTIDVMAMLQRRTKGNLSAEESRFLEEVLHSLRLSFINAKKHHG
jgi:hypothetical protein